MEHKPQAGSVHPVTNAEREAPAIPEECGGSRSYTSVQVEAAGIQAEEDTRTPAELLDIIERKGGEVAKALKMLRSL